MSMTTVQVDSKAAKTLSKSEMCVNHLRDLAELTKPRITAMVLVTIVLSYFVATLGQTHWLLLLHVLLGTTLVAASSGALNQLMEAETDARMKRTANRPLPSGRMSSAEVVWFSAASLMGGMAYLILTVGWGPAGWALATWIVYVCVYTPMKTRSHWNTFVGAISGALPILIGWSASRQAFTWDVGAMISLLFLWQFPHFLAIAWIYRHQYDDAGLKMLTTTDPTGRAAGWVSVCGAVCVWASSLLPLLSSDSFSVVSVIYVALITALGWYQLRAALRFQKNLTDPSAKKLLLASVLYLPLALGLIAVHAVL